MKIDRHVPTWWPVAVLCALTLALAPSALHAQVTVDVEVTGTPMPGATVTATADVTIEDGSTIQSYEWMQTYGVDAVLSGAATDTVTVTLGSRDAYKAMLFHVLAEPPISEADLPPNVPLPEGEFPGGIQDRFQVVALNPFNSEETALVKLEVEVVTTSGTYHGEAEIHAALPWVWTTGLRNVPVGDPVLLHGKDQAAYDWTLMPASGSGATLMDATTQNPEFTPDVAGHYVVEVTDEASGETVSMSIYAGTWRGIIVGEDADGRPEVDPACLSCHNDEAAPDVFAEWKQTGHAEIFKDNLNTSTHYGSSCFPCHTVGYNPAVDNGGIDDADDYQAFLDAGLINNPSDDNYATVLQQFPHTAQHANIQCENCHGPQNSQAHIRSTPRISLSSDVCASCHGEPLRHGRYQQWQLSPHANYELAIDEGTSGSCARCHTGNGFLKWLPVLLGEEAGDPTANIEVDWAPEDTHPQTCQTCHDPHNIGTASGEPTNATVRIAGDTPMLIAGFQATDVGRGAICMTCHNSRRGLRNDDNFFEVYGTSEAARATHPGPQADVLMGQNAYLVETGIRGNHSMTSNVQDTCVTCHMESTPPPDLLSYDQGGTNHTFFASKGICADCHTNVTASNIQGPVSEQLHELEGMIESHYIALMAAQIAGGNSIDLGGDATITDAASIAEVQLSEYHGSSALIVSLMDGGTIGPVGLSSIDVVPPSGAPFAILDVANPNLIKATWNYNLIHADGSLGVHNPDFVVRTLVASRDALLSGAEPCVPDADTLCLNDDRFRVEVNWRDHEDRTGTGQTGGCGTDDSGLLWFFNPDNIEMLVKVLDGCSVNNRFWVFFAATTDVEFTMTVTDTETGLTKAYNNHSQSYTNPLGQPANAVTDTNAFATCP